MGAKAPSFGLENPNVVLELSFLRAIYCRLKQPALGHELTRRAIPFRNYFRLWPSVLSNREQAALVIADLRRNPEKAFLALVVLCAAFGLFSVATLLSHKGIVVPFGWESRNLEEIRGDGGYAYVAGTGITRS